MVLVESVCEFLYSSNRQQMFKRGWEENSIAIQTMLQHVGAVTDTCGPSCTRTGAVPGRRSASRKRWPTPG